jgi:hypothetical protein
VGQAPVKATVFEMERLRCNACCEVFTAAEPAGAGAAKYDMTAVAMIALLKYGTGMPFHRMERLETQLGIPLPAATQWELMESAADSVEPILNELIRQAAQGGLMHNDDTSMRVLKLVRSTDDGRTGVFTSGIVSILGGWKIALYFTGWKHAGENLADVLRRRAAELDAPIQMCDALSRNTPKTAGRGDPASQLPGAWKTAGCRRCRELPRRVPVCAGDSGHGLQDRRSDKGAATIAGKPATVSSGTQRTVDG